MDWDLLGLDLHRCNCNSQFCQWCSTGRGPGPCNSESQEPSAENSCHLSGRSHGECQLLQGQEVQGQGRWTAEGSTSSHVQAEGRRGAGCSAGNFDDSCAAYQYMDMAPPGDMEGKAQKMIKDLK